MGVICVLQSSGGDCLRTMAPKPTSTMRSSGQGALQSRTAANHMSSAVSIVRRLTQREHSGRNLAVLVHQHFGYQVHYTWECTFGNRSFERRFRSHEAVLAFCSTVETGTLEGLCSCAILQRGFFRVSGAVYTKTALCDKRIDGPWFSVRDEREWHENDADAVRCKCKVTSSADMQQ
jgi:hypothetical protein